MKRWTKRTHWRVVLAWVAALGLAGAAVRPAAGAQPAVLEQIPDDAAAVLVITNVKNFSTRVANMGVRMGLQLPPDPMGIALRNVRIVKGFDGNNSAALVVLKPAAAKEGAAPDDAEAAAGPAVVILLPTTDAKLMLEQWEPGDADKSGIAEVSLPTGRMARGFVATAGNYVAIAQDHDVLARFLTKKQALSKTLPADAAKAMERDDLVFYANVPAFAKVALDGIEKHEEEFLGQMDLDNLQSGNETSAALRKGFFSLFFDGTKQFLKDANTGLLTVRLSEAGVNLGVAAQFKQDSAFGKFVAAQKPVHAPTLAGLPDGAFSMAGAVALEPKSVVRLIGDVTDRMLKDPVVAKDAKLAEFKKGANLMQQSVGLIEGYRFVLFTAPHDPKKSPFNGAAIIDTTDAAKYMAVEMELLNNPMSSESMDPDLLVSTAVTVDAITVKGVKFTKVVKKIQLREETPEHPLAASSKMSFNSAKAIYGTDGIVMYLGSVDKKVLMIMGAEATTIDALVDAVQKKSEALATSKAITTAGEQVVANPVVVTYMTVEPWLAIGQTMMFQTLGLPQDKAAAMAAAAPAASAPSVMSVGITDTTVNAEIHMPVSAMANVVKWAGNLKAILSGQGEMPPGPEAPPEK